ncbi:MAG TPA: hypothetical protein VHC22_04290 [Pirellulales bacterium]|nr:hypothetical protein [Pirellulales bacterium]
MHTVELLEEALRAAGALGYKVRQEWLAGGGGGECELKGRKHLFIDLSLSISDQLQVALDALDRANASRRLVLSDPLRRALVAYQTGLGRAA